MMERYRVLGAMLALKEFTVNDLSRYSEVKPNTVHTTINREQKYLEKTGKEETGRRGGQCQRWRVKPDEVENLRLEFDQLFSQIKVSPGALPEPESAPEIPLG
ncbi:MAG: helix-turn-helix domain-containing protein, partial [Pyrinomonadaceae bacterium]